MPHAKTPGSSCANTRSPKASASTCSRGSLRPRLRPQARGPGTLGRRRSAPRFRLRALAHEAHAPDKEHPRGRQILREQGYSEEIVRAILSTQTTASAPLPARAHPLRLRRAGGFLTALPTFARQKYSGSGSGFGEARMKDRLRQRRKPRRRPQRRRRARRPARRAHRFCIAPSRTRRRLGLRGTIAPAQQRNGT